MPDNKKIAADVLTAVGGKDNVTSVTHCMTRLRFTLKDNGIPNTDQVKRIKGVIGAQESGGQYQVIIGQNVPKVYDEVCTLGGFAKNAAINENLDADLPMQKLTPKQVWDNVLNYVSGSMVQLIPILMTAGLFKCIGVLIGPDMFGLVSAEDPLYLLMYTYLFDAGMYFLPIYLGYSAAKKIGATPVLGMLMGGILISPGIVELASSGEASFSVYGISAPLIDYSQSVLPVLLCVAVLYFVEKFFKRVVPDTLSTVFTPFFTMVIMVPLGFVVIAPIGQECGELLAVVLYGISEMGGVGYLVAMALVGGFWQLLVITGMHTAIIMPAIVTFMELQKDSFLFVASNIAMLAVWGMIAGAFFRIRNKEEKSLAAGYFISALFGGVTEPALFGLLMRFKRTIPCVVIAGAAGSVLAGILGVTLYMPGASSNIFMLFVGYIAGGTGNFIVTIASFALAFVLGAVLTYLFGFSKEELAELDAEDEASVAPELAA